MYLVYIFLLSDGALQQMLTSSADVLLGLCVMILAFQNNYTLAFASGAFELNSMN